VSSAAVSVTELRKSYGGLEAVRGISFAVAAGEIFGLLGPNGAGKTTTIECLEGIRIPDSGEIRVAGYDPRTAGRELRERIGVQLQQMSLYDKITVLEALKLFSGFYRRQLPLPWLMERFNLVDKAGAAYDSLSGGQKQRVALALALVNDPEVVFLDEPTAGLDAHARLELHDVIQRLRGEGRTLILTTHYIEEAERLCDRVAVVERGLIVGEGAPRELVRQSTRPARVEFRASEVVPLEALERLPGVTAVENGRVDVTLLSRSPGRTVIDLIHLLEERRAELIDLRVVPPSLEDVFIELTGRSIAA
jgi:ABC-2 type transport system ATP-binding protein